MNKILLHFILVLLLINAINLFGQITKKGIDSVNAVSHESIVSSPGRYIKMFSRNLENAKAIGYKYGAGKASGKLALADYMKGYYDESTSHWIEAIKIFEELKSYEDLAYSYGEFGYELKRSDLKKALYYMNLGIKLAEQNRLNKILTGLYDNYGVLKEMGNEIDSALYYYKKALNMKYKNSDSLGIPYSLNNISGIYAIKGEFNRAFEYLTLSDSFRRKEKGSYGRAENLGIRANLYSMIENTDSAIISYSECLKLSRELKINYFIQLCYQQLTGLYEKKNEHKKALESYKNFTAIKDSILNIETNERIAGLQIAFETEKKDRIIANDALKMKQKTLQLFIMGGAIVLMIIIAVWTFKYQKQKRERIRNELELKHKLNTAELENKLRSEKLRISKELHDNIGSQLTFMISSLDNMIYSLKDNNILGRVNTLRNFSRDTLMELRNTVWAIKNEEGDSNQLILRLREMVQRLSNDIISIKIVLKNNLLKNYKLSSVQMLNIFRIIQEAVQNTVKHAGSTEIIIEFCEGRNSGFLTIISDNGKGFDTDKEYSGNGIKNMELRCEEVGGVFSISSNNNGSKISCLFEKLEIINCFEQ